MITQHELSPGVLLQGKYKIETLIGQGGFGITYKALNLGLNKNVCIKELFISGNCTRGENNTVLSQGLKELSFNYFKERFIKEARELAKFSHPGIVRIIDVFEENSTAYFVMEYIEGETLKNLITREGRLIPEKALPIMKELMEAVKHVHQKEMLHRDIKPDNVLIDKSGNAILIDFGSARQFSEGKTVTQTALITPGYAPLEQYDDQARKGPYTDVYSLGATLYFLLTGQKPLPATSRHSEIMKAPHQLFSDIPVSLSSAVMLALNLKPENRFQTVGDFQNALINNKKEQQKITVIPAEFKEKITLKSNQLIIAKLLGFLSVTVILYFLLWPLFKSVNALTKEQAQLLVENYYIGIANPDFNAEDYYADHVNQYVKWTDITPDSVEKEIKNNTDYLYRSYKFDTKTISFISIIDDVQYWQYWVDFSCYRASKGKWKTCRVLTKVGIDEKNKFVSYEEIKVTNLKYSY